MKIALWGPVLAAGLLWSGAAHGAKLYRSGCEHPYPDVSVCWEATGENSAPAGLQEMVMLPLIWEQGGEPQVLSDMSRKIYRQLRPGELADSLRLEWSVARHIDEVEDQMAQARWPAVLWIQPRQMRESGPATPGVMDWNVHLLSQADGGEVRTLRVRVESWPHRKTEAEGDALAAGALGTVASGGGILTPLVAGTVATAMAQERPPQAGYSLELMGELATRQVAFLMQHALDEFQPPGVTPPPGRLDRFKAAWKEMVEGP
ncbi:MAG: hypothetical protein H7831_11205 [Magnetococcus sp. WYHC-3]